MYLWNWILINKLKSIGIKKDAKILMNNINNILQVTLNVPDESIRTWLKLYKLEFLKAIIKVNTVKIIYFSNSKNTLYAEQKRK